MTKIVINAGCDALCLNHEAMSRYIELSQRPILTHDEVFPDCDDYVYHHYMLNGEPFGDYNIERTDPALIQVVEETEKECCTNGQLRVVEIPDGVEWEILSIGGYDGCSESVHEKHRSWSFDSKQNQVFCYDNRASKNDDQNKIED